METITTDLDTFEEGDALDYDPLADDEPRTAPSSVFEKLRAEHEAALADTTLDLDVPTFGGKLVARHRALDYKETEKIARSVDASKHPKRVLLGMVDTIVRSCDELWWRDSPDADLVALADELSATSGNPEEPVRFDERLARAMGWASTSARGVVLDAFGKELAVMPYYHELTRWMESGRKAAADDFAGEA